MKHGSLFSGIGGFDLAAEWAGWENVFHCEINPFGQQVLKYYWPDSEMIDDVKDIEKFKKYEGTVDIISGGFPCQPFSLAGKRKGTEDDRHLWPAMLEVIRTVKPTWVVGENVYGIVSWDGGLVFEQVQSDLESIGYEVQAYVIPACAIDAPHRRDRTWFVAHSAGNGCLRCNCKDEIDTNERGFNALNDIEYDDITYSKSTRLERGNGTQKPIRSEQGNKKDVTYAGCEQTRSEKKSKWTSNYASGCFTNFPTQPTIRRGNDGFSPELVGITVSKHRNESIKAYGNAVVPQLVYQIFKAINEYEKITKQTR